MGLPFYCYAVLLLLSIATTSSASTIYVESQSSMLTTATRGDDEYQAIVVTSALTRDLYVSGPCAGESAVLAPCSTGDDLCVQDGLIVSFPASLMLNGRISNYASCTGSFVVSLTGGRGIQSVTLDAGNFSQPIVDEITDGVTPVFVCCQELRAQAGGSWNGSFTISVVPHTTSTQPFTLLVPSDPSRLPISDYYQAIPVSVECNNVPLACNDGCPINVRPTADPFYSMWSAAMENIVGGYIIDLRLSVLSNAISTVVWVTKIPVGNRVGSLLFGLGETVLDNKTGTNLYFSENCTLKYYGLVDSTGASISVQTLPATQFDTACNSAVYDQARQDFDIVISNLDDEKLITQDTTSTLAYIDLAKTVAWSNAWQNCKRLALSMLSPNTTLVTENTQDCFYPEGTAAWNTDPCCNEELLDTACCHARPYEFSYVSYQLPSSFDPATDLQGCIFPDCLVQPLKNLQGVTGYASQYSCSAARNQVVSDQDFTSIWDDCYGRVYSVICSNDIACSSFDRKSLCIKEQSTCTIPCDTDADCFVGICGNLDGYGKTCIDTAQTAWNSPERDNAFFACTLAKVEPHLALDILGEVERSSNTDDTPAQKFAQLIKSESCVSTHGFPWAIPLETQDECEASAGFCPWRYCYIGYDTRSAGDLCEHDVCMNEIPADNYCGYRFHPDYGVNVVGRPADVCQVNIDETGTQEPEHNATLCYQIGGTVYGGYSASDYRAWGSCRTDDITPQTCIRDFCIDQYMNATCASYCMDPTLDSSTCVGTSPAGNSRIFHSWRGQYSNNMMSACVLEGEKYDSCVLGGNTWVSGREFLPKFLAGEASCPQQLCYDVLTGPLYNVTTADACYVKTCTSCITGEEPSCSSQEACEATSGCNVVVGCKFPRNFNELLGFDSGCTWTPNSCIGKYTEEFCSRINIAIGYQYPLDTEADCLGNLEICNDGSIPDAVIHNPSSLPKGFNLRNRTECEKCDGTMQPYWSWEQAKWVANDYLIGPEWLKKELLYPQWKAAPSLTNFISLLEKASAHRLATILVSELYCLYGVESQLLSLVSYACGEGESNSSGEKALVSLQGSPVSVLSTCQGIAEQISVQGFNFNVSPDFTVQSQDTEQLIPCVKAKVFIVPLEQFSYVEFDITSSLSIVSETESTKSSSTHVYNDNDVVVGKIVGDGIALQFMSNMSFNGLVLCMPLPSAADINWDLHAGLFSWDVASANSEFDFTPLRFGVDLEQTQICINVSSSDLLYFPMGIIENWEDATIVNSWSSTEKGLIIFCIVMYLIVFCYTLANFLLRLVYSNWYKRIPLAEAALFLILVLSGVGASYLLIILTGHIRDNHVDPLFTDLPALCLLTCVVLIIISWQHIIDAVSQMKVGDNMLKQFMPIFALIPLYLVFIGLLVSAAAINESTEFTCATTIDEEEALSLTEKLSLSYKAIFAAYVFFIALAFIHSSYAVYQLLSKIDTTKEMIEKNAIATFCAAIALFVLVAITLYTTTHDLENTTKLAFTITVLILPAYAIAYLFSFKSSFTTKLVTTFSKKPKSGSNSKSTSTVI